MYARKRTWLLVHEGEVIDPHRRLQRRREGRDRAQAALAAPFVPEADIRGCSLTGQFLQSTTDRSSGRLRCNWIGGTRAVSAIGVPVASARSKSAVPASSTAVTANASNT